MEVDDLMAGAEDASAPDVDVVFCELALRAMSARTVLSHFISSSSLGAQRSKALFIVTILKVN